MKLTAIAHDMKTRAKQTPHQIITLPQPLAHGARLKLKYDDTQYEFRLQIQRNGVMPPPNSRYFNAWHLEVETFARDFDATSDARVQFQQGAQSYAAVVVWCDEVTVRDIDEMENVPLEALAANGENGLESVESVFEEV